MKNYTAFFTHKSGKKSIADEMPITASNIYKASVKFWKLIDKSDINTSDVQFVWFKRV